MRKSTEKKNMVLTYMIERSKNNIFTGTMSHIAEDLDFNHASSVRNYIIQLIEDGNIEYVVEPERGRNVAKYRILKDVQTQEGELIINFRGQEIKMVYDSTMGWVLSESQLCKITDDYSDYVDYVIQRNKELFSNQICIINEERHFSRLAIMTYINRLHLDQVSENKRKSLIEFNEIVREKMCDVIARGKVMLSRDGKISIQHNLSNLCEITLEQAKDLVEDIEKQFSQIFNGEVDELNKEKRKAENLLNLAIQERNNAIGELNRRKVGN